MKWLFNPRGFFFLGEKPIAKVTPMMPPLWRGHAWNGQGYSTSTFINPTEAQEWAEATAKENA